MAKTMAVSYYRNLKTGELAPPHRIGETDDDEAIYCFVEGWGLADSDGEFLPEDTYWIDEGGNWIVKEPHQGYPQEWQRPINY